MCKCLNINNIQTSCLGLATLAMTNGLILTLPVALAVKATVVLSLDRFTPFTLLVASVAFGPICYKSFVKVEYVFRVVRSKDPLQLAPSCRDRAHICVVDLAFIALPLDQASLLEAFEQPL